MVVGTHGRFGLFGDAGLFTQVDFGFEDLQNFQDD
jgi:hypothetical protein